MGTPTPEGPAKEAPSFDSAGAAVLLLDEHGVVTGWNTEAAELLGPPVDVLGRRAVTLLAPDDQARAPAIAQRCRNEGGWAGELTALRRDGRPVTVAARAVPITGSAAPGTAQWLVLAVDVTGTTSWVMRQSILKQLFERLSIGMAVVDTDLRFVWSNAALERFGAGPGHERLGLRLAEVQPGLDTELIEAQMRRVLQTGVPITEFEHVGHPRSASGPDRAHSMSFSRLQDDTGRALGVFYTVLDITDRYRTRQRLALLDRASTYIGRSLDVLQTAQDLADVAVPDVADFVVVDLLETVVRGGEPADGLPRDTDAVALIRSGEQSVRAGVPEAVFEIGGRATYHAWSPPIRCLISGRSMRQARLDQGGREWATNIAGGRATVFGKLGLHSAMVVPIRARGVTLGLTLFYRRQRQEPFDDDDLRLAEEFVARAAVCIDNARRYTRERDAALALQRNLLPHSLPDQEAVEVASCYRPADELAGVGGDWFDVVPLSGARVALVVGEVIGHGIDAAATMGRLRTAVQTLAYLDLRPEELLAHLDDLVTRTLHESDLAGTPAAGAQAAGASCLYAVYDPVTRQCSMATAGHPTPAIVAADGTVTFPDVPHGPALGVGGLPYESADLVLAEGSILALYTDGLLAGTEPAGDARERLRQALEASGPSLDGLAQAVVDRLAPARPRDDVALLLARTRSLGRQQVATWDLPSDPAEVAHARKAATRQLGDWELDELAFTTELVVSELVTNAIRHATGPIRLRLINERTLICEVSDSSDTSPHLHHARAMDEGGRGLFLISQFAHRWGTRYTADGKVIWAEQLRDHPPTAL